MEGIADTNPVPEVEEHGITSAAETGTGPAEPTVTVGSGVGNGSDASFPWSLTHEKQVYNLKENWKKAFTWNYFRISFGDEFETNPWFASIVSQLRVDPCLDSCDELEIDASLIGPLVSGFRMTSLDVAILMGDLKMVRKILERSSNPDKLIRGSLVDIKRASDVVLLVISKECKQTGVLYTPLHLAVAGGDSHLHGRAFGEGC